MTQASDERELQDALSFGYELDASPAKVWRALTVPAFVAQWLTAQIVEPDAETPQDAHRRRCRSPFICWPLSRAGQFATSGGKKETPLLKASSRSA